LIDLSEDEFHTLSFGEKIEVITAIIDKFHDYPKFITGITDICDKDSAYETHLLGSVQQLLNNDEEDMEIDTSVVEKHIKLNLRKYHLSLNI
jgi:hypothetical protein